MQVTNSGLIYIQTPWTNDVFQNLACSCLKYFILSSNSAASSKDLLVIMLSFQIATKLYQPVK
jgi:hypothetical protein